VSNNREHIDFELLENYLSGKLSEIEKNAFEKRALDDPFLQDAIDGYEANPEALKGLKHQINNQKKANRSFFGSRTLAVLGVAVLAYLMAYFFYSPNQESTDSHSAQNEMEPKNVVEVELLRPDIDTLIVQNNEELNEAIQMKSEQKEIIKTEDPDADSSSYSYQEIIEIDENFEHIDHSKVEPEINQQKITVYAPMTYLSELYVIDYREIKRSKSSLSYTRFEFTGVSAAFEDSAAQSNQDLVEREVEIPYMEYLEKSMEYFSNKRYKKALNRYTTILEQYPKDLNALFYGAHCYFNTSQYSKALDFFRRAQEIEKEHGFVGFRQELKWYEAKTLIKLNQKKEARAILDKIIIEGLFYANQAIELKKKL